jgi:hypothetical protein
MDPREVVMHLVQRDGVDVILDSLAERVGQAREAALLDGGVVVFGTGRANVSQQA